MNEGLSMYQIERNWNDAYVQGKLIFTHTVTLESMNKAKLSQRGFGALFVSWDEVFSSNLTTSYELSQIDRRMNSLRELKCGVH